MELREGQLSTISVICMLTKTDRISGPFYFCLYLNPGGVRIGTAEIYQQVNALPEVEDSIAVGKLNQQSEEIWLLVTLARKNADKRNLPA